MATLSCVAFALRATVRNVRCIARSHPREPPIPVCIKSSYSTTAHAILHDSIPVDNNIASRRSSPTEAYEQNVCNDRATLEDVTRALVDAAEILSPAQDLRASLLGIARWPYHLDSAVGQATNVQQRLEDCLAEWSISVQDWLAFRNALVSKTWPEVRTQMRGVADGAWPSFVLTHAVTLVSTISESSDALAVLAETIRREETSRSVAFEAHRKAFDLLSDTILVKHHGLNLIPRLTEVLFGLLSTSGPAVRLSSSDFVRSHVRRLCKHADNRAREAVLRLLKSFPLVTNEDALALHGSIILIALESERLGARGSGSYSRSSHRFCNGTFMDEIMPQIAAEDRRTLRWAHRVAIAVAGRERMHYKIDALFDELLRLRDDTTTIRTSDLLLYAKALARTPEGHQRSLRALSQVGRELSSEEMRYKGHHRDGDFRLDLLGVVSKNPSFPTTALLSLVGIDVQDTDVIHDPSSLAESVTSEQLALSPYAYSVVMQGLIARKEVYLVPKVWRIMLDRRVAPSIASLSTLLRALFDLGHVRAAMQQLELWLEKGVPFPEEHDQEHQPRVGLISMTASSLTDELAVQFPAEENVEHRTVRLEADPMLATTVFAGLNACGAQGIDTLWATYQKTIALFPDPPIFCLLLKCTCVPSSSDLTPSLGREMFRSLLFEKHPELRDYRNPLCEELEFRGPSSWLFSEEAPDARMGRWFMSMFTPGQVALAPITHKTDRLVFNTHVFHHYMRLLLHIYHSSYRTTPSGAVKEELLNTLGWMKELGVLPTDGTIALAVLEIEERLPPALAVGQMDKIDAWLVDWLGPERMPTDASMRIFFEWKRSRNERNSGWFDRVRSSKYAPSSLDM